MADGTPTSDGSELAEPVHLLRTTSEFHATWIADALRDNGIPAAVIGAHTSALVPLGSMLPVWVMVQQGDYQLAREALETDVIGGPPRALTERCRECGYDLGGLPEEGLCPECGEAFDRSAEARPRYEFAPPPGATLGHRLLATVAATVTLVALLGGLVIIVMAVI